MSEEKLLKYYGCNSLSEFIDTYLDCETAFDLLRSQFKEIERLNNIIEQTQKILYIKLMNENKEKIYIQEVIDIIENLKGSDKE